MLTDQQVQSLKAMGVIVWRLRHSNLHPTMTSGTSFYYCCHLLGSSLSPIAVVLAESSNDPELKEKEEPLLIAICKALGKPFQAAAPIAARLDQLESYIRKFPTTILLGEKLAQQCLATDKDLNQIRGKRHDVFNSKIFVTDALANLLTNPQLKGPAWRDLKDIPLIEKGEDHG